MKFSSTMKQLPLLCLLLFVGPTTQASAKMSCEAISGSWTGRMSGLYNGATTMTITDNCRLNRTLPDGRLNKCRYREKSGQVEYSCSLGSRGVVAINGNRITIQNVYTAKRHGAYTVKWTRD
jgi:hypothetical protein